MDELLYALFPPAEERWIIVTATLTAVACSLVGNFLVLRRLSLLGDAISHAVLPGLVVAFAFTGVLNIGGMLLGAMAAALLTGWLIELLDRTGGSSSDAHMGIVFTSMFALGVILLRVTAAGADLDSSCVFEGQLAQVGNNLTSVFGWRVPRAVLAIAPALVLNAAALTLCWKELKLATFDPALAASMGFRPAALHWLLITLSAATTVGSFEAVGSILVVGMLIVPAATAQLLTDSLPRMVLLSALCGGAAAYVGCVASLLLDVEPGGMVALSSGCLFFAVMLLSPRYGLIAKLRRRMRLSLRIAGEDLLAMLYRLEELHVDPKLPVADARRGIGGGWTAWCAERLLRSCGLIQCKRDAGSPALQLTPAGRAKARGLVRAHRLWEAYLAQRLGLPLDHVHEPAERMEHYLDSEIRGALAADIRPGDTDPHGKPIPPEGG